MTAPCQSGGTLQTIQVQVTNLREREVQTQKNRKQVFRHPINPGPDLVWFHTVGAEVGVPRGRVDAVLLKVLADVLRGGLRQQSVNTGSEERTEVRGQLLTRNNQLIGFTETSHQTNDF